MFTRDVLDDEFRRLEKLVALFTAVLGRLFLANMGGGSFLRFSVIGVSYGPRLADMRNPRLTLADLFHHTRRNRPLQAAVLACSRGWPATSHLPSFEGIELSCSHAGGTRGLRCSADPHPHQLPLYGHRV